MTPKLLEWIPVYGSVKYFRRYFEADSRDAKEANIALWFEVYHVIIATLLILFLLFKIIPKLFW